MTDQPKEIAKREDFDEYVNQMRDDITHYVQQIRELRAQLAQALEGKVPDLTEWDATRFFAYSGVNQFGQGFVKLRLGSTIMQCDLASARSIALDILGQSEAAYADQTIFQFFHSDMGITSVPELLNMVAAYRNSREAQQAEVERG